MVGAFLPVLATLWLSPPASGRDPVPVRGTLRVEAGGSFLEAAGNRLPLGSRDRNIAATLADGRLSGKVLEMSGERRPDGSLEVRDLFVVVSGRLLRVIYYCTVCSTLDFLPGTCPCCQEPLDPTYVPPSDPRIAVETPSGGVARP